MNKRVIAAASAGVLALLGVLVLVMWAQGANDRAFEGAKLVSVVRFTDNVNANTSTAELLDKTEVVKLPAEAVPAGAVTNLDQVVGRETNASVQKGEMLLKSRMVAPGERGKGSTSVPKGYQEMTISLDAEHTVGGAVKSGDRVGIMSSFDAKDGKPQATTAILDNVLITKIGGQNDAKDITAQLVTVAVTSDQAKKIAYARDFGRVWLTMQNTDTTKADTKPVTSSDVLK